MLIVATLLFALGIGIGYFTIPYALNFLLGLTLPGVETQLRLSEYVSFVSTVMLAFGLAFQFPVLLLLLARVGILNYRFLSARRRWAILAIVLFAIIATPGRRSVELDRPVARHVRPLRGNAPADPQAPAMSVWLLTDAAMDAHAAPGHPERPERRGAAADGVRRSGRRPARGAIGRADRPLPRSSSSTIRPTSALLGDAEARGGGWLDPDTYLVPGSLRAAMLAAGATLQAAIAAGTGAAEVAFAAVRPPGHHAARGRGSGFCLLNNVAIAVAGLRARGIAERIAIVDWDVHHGNGTQAIFDADPALCYASTHESPHYPGTGARGETGAGAAARHEAQPAVAARKRRRGVRCGLAGGAAARHRGVRARGDPRVGGVRRPRRRPARRARGHRGGLRGGGSYWSARSAPGSGLPAWP